MNTRKCVAQICIFLLGGVAGYGLFSISQTASTTKNEAACPQPLLATASKPVVAMKTKSQPISDENKETLSACIADLSLAERRLALAEVLQSFASRDPMGTLEWYLNKSETEFHPHGLSTEAKLAMFRTAFGNLVSRDPESALRFVGAIQDSIDRTFAVEILAQTAARSGQSLPLFSHAAKVEDADLRRAMMTNVLAEWAAFDAAGAKARFDSLAQADRDTVDLRRFSEGLLLSEPDTAAAFLYDNSQDKSRAVSEATSMLAAFGGEKQAVEWLEKMPESSFKDEGWKTLAGIASEQNLEAALAMTRRISNSEEAKNSWQKLILDHAGSAYAQSALSDPSLPADWLQFPTE